MPATYGSCRAIPYRGILYRCSSDLHPFFTDNTEPVTDADITHRQHAIIESVFADLIDVPLAHLPSGHTRQVVA